MSIVYHVAGEPVALVQRCLRCRAILTDNNGALMAGDRTGPIYFPAYRLIAEESDGLWVATGAGADDVRAFMCQSTEVFQ